MGVKTENLKTLCQQLGLKYVGHRGRLSSPIWELGEAPGADEDRSGYPFTGPSGWEFDRMLADAGFDKGDLCFTNPYKIRPPDNDLDRIQERGIPKDVFEEQFFEELFEYKPTFIIPNGAVSLGLLCPDTIDRKTKKPIITNWRGSLLTSFKLPWPHYVIPNVHPAYILRNWSERDFCIFIHQKIKEEFDYWKVHKILQPLPSRQLLFEPSYEDAVEYLIHCLAAKFVSVDLELLARRVPFVFGFSYDPSHALSLEMLNANWTPQQLRKIWRLTDEILKSKQIVGQNYTEFDANWIDCLGFNPGIDKCHDTRVRHHVLWPELPHSLQFMTIQYTRQPYYKDEGRGWHLGRNLGQLKRYNCLDASVTLEIFHEQEKEFEEDAKKKCEHTMDKDGEQKSTKIQKQAVTYTEHTQNLAEEKSDIQLPGSMESQPISTDSSGKKNMALSQKDRSFIISAEESTASISSTSKLQTEKAIHTNSTRPLSTESERKFKNLREFYEEFEMPLARTFFYTDKRGLYTNEQTRRYVRAEVVSELQTLCKEIENLTGVKCVPTK